MTSLSGISPSRGHASGWSVAKSPNHLGMYQWSAFGRWGSTMSQARTPEAAEAQARAAMASLDRAFGGPR